jgi:hypothetical protein
MRGNGRDLGRAIDGPVFFVASEPDEKNLVKIYSNYHG